ncbi:hypothetical protein BJ912DRAFT_991819 [Pholiota molesta]|nr:hypothetical protein BJ912DRAFT_991819 [Pholiota molesta]
MDNIRTTALSLIILQNAAIQAVSTHRQAAQVHETWPKSFIFINLFVGMTRLLAVPLLFFVAGFSSQFTMVMHGRSPIRFVLRRTWKTAITVVFYQAFVYLAKLVHPLPPAETAATAPYYASREGVLALLNGPTAYVLAVLALDYIYAFFRTVNLLTSSPNKPTYFITTNIRFAIVKLLFIVVEFWVFIYGNGLARKIFPTGSAAEHWLYAVNSADLHFPLLYLIAYTAGVHFVHYYKFILANTQGLSFFSPATGLVIRLGFTTTLLYGSYRAAPDSIAPFFDVRQRPALVFPQPAVSAFYATWVVYTLMLVPEAVIGVFLTSRALAMDWGSFSRTAHLQVYVQMLYVVGNQVRVFDNMFLRWAMLGWMAIYYAHYGGIGMIALGNFAKRGWFAVRGRLNRRAEHSISI